VADDDRDTIRAEFREAVNMSASELEQWLQTDESQAVGQKSGGSGESTGHESGRRIVEILHTKKDDLTDDDLAHMRKVHGYVQRHLAQEPAKEDVETSKWRYSLMNWGHDPLKKK
jgi:DNA topoisomerase VI subunit B